MLHILYIIAVIIILCRKERNPSGSDSMEGITACLFSKCTTFGNSVKGMSDLVKITVIK